MNTKINKITEDFKGKIIFQIEKIKLGVQKQTGSFKYDDCYDDCIEVIKNCELDDAMITEVLTQAYKQGKIEATVEETAQYKEDMKKAKEEARREEVKIGEKDNQGKDEAWCEWYKCSKCACTMITYEQKYCGECGSSLIWDPPLQ